MVFAILREVLAFAAPVAAAACSEKHVANIKVQYPLWNLSLLRINSCVVKVPPGNDG
jgi:hypothetical protein